MGCLFGVPEGARATQDPDGSKSVGEDPRGSLDRMGWKRILTVIYDKSLYQG